jgi:hypothetical protein
MFAHERRDLMSQKTGTSLVFEGQVAPVTGAGRLGRPSFVIGHALAVDGGYTAN